MQQVKARPARLSGAVLFVSIILSAPALAMDECEIDDAMRLTRENTIKAESTFVDKGLRDQSMKTAEQVDTKEGACLPSLDGLGTDIMSKFPGLGGGNIFDAIKNMICRAGDQFIRDTVEGMDYSIGDPYGIAQVGIGGSTTGGSRDHQEYSFGEAVLGGVESAAEDRIDEASRNFPKVTTPSHRGPARSGSGAVGDGVQDALKDL